MELMPHQLAAIEQLGNEEWVPIREAPDYYISSSGKVWSTITDRLLKPGLAGKGYPFVWLTLNGQKFQRYVHILVAQHFVPGEDFSLEVNHKDLDKTNANNSNLEWTTHKENQEHAQRAGRFSNSGRTKTRIRIIETGEIFESQHSCARAIGGRQSSIHACLSGRLKSHLGYTFEYV